MSGNRRKVLGLSIAIVLLAGIALYSVRELEDATQRGWAGFSYVPPARAGSAKQTAGVKPGSVVFDFGGAPAERSGIRRGDVIESINGIPASDFTRMTGLNRKVHSGDLLTYRINRNGRTLDVSLRLDSPLRSPLFAASFAITVASALAFFIIGALVFWRRPLDPRATVFFAMTLVASLTMATQALLPAEEGYRGIVGGDESLNSLWHLGITGAASLFFAPLLLHLALIFPAERPVMRRRGILAWIYGYPLTLCAAGLVGIGCAAYLSANKNTSWLTTTIEVAIAVIAIAALTRVGFSMARRGAKEGIARVPLAVDALAISLLATILIFAGNATSRSHSPMPLFFGMFTIVLLGIAAFSTYPIATFMALLRSYRESGVEQRRQVKWPLWATMVAVGGKLVLSLFGFALVILSTFGNVNLPGAVALCPEIIARTLYILIPLGFAFAILKYRLMDIDVIIRRTVLYSILTGSIFVLYAFLVVVLGTTLVKFVGLRTPTMLVASTVIIALVTVPLRNRLQRVVDRNLFRERSDYPLALRNIGSAISTSGDADTFLRYAAEQIQQALKARAVMIAVRRDREYVAAAKVGLPDDVIGSVRIPTDVDTAAVPRELSKLGIARIVTVKAHREPAALLCVGSKLSDQDFSNDDFEFLDSAASQMAVGIENLRLRDEEVEFEQARAMQQILLPKRFPQLDHVEIVGEWVPARTVGGDYFDTLPLGDGKAAICIGDVAGKGMPAALLMANLQAAVKATAAASVPPATVCERVKEIVGGNLSGGKFISFFYGVLDAGTRTFTYSNAGHNPPIVVRADGGVERLSLGGPVMSRLFKSVRHEQDHTPIHPGDRIVLFTDGVSEARRGDDEFGEERLIDLLVRARHLNARDLQQCILGALRDFTAGDLSDDVTFVVIAAQ